MHKLADDKFVEEDQEIMRQAHNYIDYEYSFVSRYIGKRVLEVGGGIGNITERMSNPNRLITVIEPNRLCIEKLRARFKESRNIDILEGYLDKQSVNRIRGNNYDSIVCINVLEHIKNADDTIRFFGELASPQCNIVLIVPAHSWASGSIDTAVGHYRRYDRKPFFEMLRNNGLCITDWRYFNTIGIVGWFINARILKIQSQSPSAVKFFDRVVVPAQKYVERVLRFPFGQSLVVIAKGER